MCWLKNFMVLLTSCQLGQAFLKIQTNSDKCLSRINWRELWKQMDSLNKNGVSQECSDSDKRSLCDPAQMKLQSASDEKAIVLQVLNETAKFFEKKDVPFSNVRDFLEYNYSTQDELKICLPARFHQHLTNNTIEECFEKMEAFLNSRNSRCAWEVIQQDCLAILQQIEFYIAASKYKLDRKQIKV